MPQTPTASPHGKTLRAYRLPNGLLDWLDRAATAHHCHKTDLVIRALKELRTTLILPKN